MVVCVSPSVVCIVVWFELCGLSCVGCSPAAGCPLKEKDGDDGGCTYPTRAVPQETPEHFSV